MIFSSRHFIFAFLPIVFLLYFVLKHYRLDLTSKIWLIISSLFFYAFWNVNYLPLILGSLIFNFYAGRLLNKITTIKSILYRKTCLILSIAANLALLGYYKYIDFIIENVNILTGLSYPSTNILLPLAISFFTFQQVAYLIDCYSGNTKEYNFIDYSLFITFFPQLIAGPIVHHNEMMPQFGENVTTSLRNENIAKGIFIFSIGLIKKIVIADSFALWADSGFNSLTPISFLEAWTSSLSYTFQLYFDFSGYCDMAIGIALLFNIRLPLNFNSPYKSLDIQDFWRRWHITLGRFLSAYIYIPLGGNRKSDISTYSNLFITFLIGGLWHGASWMFIIWGSLHGMALVIHRIWKKCGFALPKAIAWLTTFLFINTSWVFFRAESLASAKTVLNGMFSIPTLSGNNTLAIPTQELAWAGSKIDSFASTLPINLLIHMDTLLLIAFAFFLISKKNAYELMHGEVSFQKIIYAGVLFSIGGYFTLSSTSSIFLYFNF